MFNRYSIACVVIVALAITAPALADPGFDGSSDSLKTTFSRPIAVAPFLVDGANQGQYLVKVVMPWTLRRDSVSPNVGRASDTADLGLFEVISSRERWLMILTGLGLAALQLRRKQRSQYHSLSFGP